MLVTRCRGKDSARTTRRRLTRNAATAIVADDEYAAGVAYTGRVGSSRTPDALYCRKLS
ncbi:hypothetical protein GCM10022233_35780 [Streptomyces shaanxiensis]|uniref:Uncharacterized protein n=1 Tax=Streptomyces shaanxiensis TaxID=653357 RepID=A0ABP7V4R9_9ACTN